MLKPAILYKAEIEKFFAEKLYTEDFFYYVGYPQWFRLPEIKDEENFYQWAILDGEKVIGYLGYRIDMYTDNVYSFGLLSFDKGNIKLARDVYNKLTELINKHHRVEWRAIQGNPAIRGYTRFCKKYNGFILTYRDAVKDIDGNYRNEYVFEVVKEIEVNGKE